MLPDSSAAVVSYHSWFRVGSRDERPGKTGQAHLLEHMMFIATESLAEGEIDRMVERAGGEGNAATWLDWTYYYENLPASELDLAIRIEADRMANLVLSPPRVASEKEVVLSERRDRVEDDVDELVAEHVFRLAYGDEHPYGWPTIGWKKDIEGFTAADCRAFYRKHYAPNRATLIVVGDVEPHDVAARVGRAYGAIPASPTRRAAFVPFTARAREKTLRLRTATEKVELAWHAPAFGHPDHAVAVVLSQILTGGRSARLYRELVHDRELAADVRASVSPFEHDSLFDIWIAARDGESIEPSLERTERAVRRLTEQPVPAEELDKVKNRLELGFLAALETIPGKAEQIGFSTVVTGDPAHAFRRLEEYRRATPEDLLRVARSIFGGPRILVRAQPHGTKSTSKPTKSTAKSGGAR